MLDDNIEPYLYDQNPWWVKSDFAIEEASLPNREIFAHILEQATNRQIISIDGLRRTGKTTILKQTVSTLLHQKRISAKNILFFSFDQNLVGRKPEILEKILNVYLEEILGMKVWELKSRAYILLDEIQYVPDWQAIIKRYYDQTRMIKFYISGSASLFIKEKTRESLAGRVFSFHLPVLSFREYLLMRKIDMSLPASDLMNADYDIRKIKAALDAYSGKINGLFEDYLRRGQFPEMAVQHDWDAGQVKQYLVDSILGKILEYDMPAYFNIKRIDELKAIFKVAAAETGNPIEFETIARDLGMSRNTVADYFSFLEKSFLINIIFNYQKSVRKGLRTAKKGYVTSTNFSAALGNISPADASYHQRLGHMVETHIVDTLLLKHHGICFLRRREKELDVVIKAAKHLIPIEIAYAGRIRPEDYANLVFFMRGFGCRRGYVLTKEATEIKKIAGGEIVFLPAWSI